MPNINRNPQEMIQFVKLLSKRTEAMKTALIRTNQLLCQHESKLDAKCKEGIKKYDDAQAYLMRVIEEYENLGAELKKNADALIAVQDEFHF